MNRSSRRKSRQPYQRPSNFFKFLGLGLLIIFLGRSFWSLAQTLINQDKPVDAILVLGGDAAREVYAAKLAIQNPNVPVLISQGSEPPCLKEMFQAEGVPLNQVWIELFAQSTFDNFFYSANILKEWKVRRVKVVTSRGHLPRAEWLGKILLGSQGIAVEIDAQGAVGYEPSAKIMLDTTRTLLWAALIQVIGVPKSNANNLNEVTSFAEDTAYCSGKIPTKDYMNQFLLPK